MGKSLEQTGRQIGTSAAGAVTAGDQQAQSFAECISAVEAFRQLPDNWDRYGGVAAAERPVQFAVQLLTELSATWNNPVPLVRPISGGVYLEWRRGDSRLYFEVDDESVLRFARTAAGEETIEDADFDVEVARTAVMDFHEHAR